MFIQSPTLAICFLPMMLTRIVHAECCFSSELSCIFHFITTSVSFTISANQQSSIPNSSLNGTTNSIQTGSCTLLNVVHTTFICVAGVHTKQSTLDKFHCDGGTNPNNKSNIYSDKVQPPYHTRSCVFSLIFSQYSTSRELNQEYSSTRYCHKTNQSVEQYYQILGWVRCLSQLTGWLHSHILRALRGKAYAECYRLGSVCHNTGIRLWK